MAVLHYWQKKIQKTSESDNTLIQVRNYIEKEGITQQDAADRMCVQRSRVGDISRGHISVFSIDSLVAMAARVNLHPVKIAA